MIKEKYWIMLLVTDNHLSINIGHDDKVIKASFFFPLFFLLEVNGITALMPTVGEADEL